MALGSYARNTGSLQVRRRGCARCGTPVRRPKPQIHASALTLHHTLLQVYELDGTDLKTVKEVEKPQAFKCGTFGASSLVERRLATGNFVGQLQIWDLENTTKPVFDVQAHASIVNQIDGFGGQVCQDPPTSSVCGTGCANCRERGRWTRRAAAVARPPTPVPACRRGGTALQSW